APPVRGCATDAELGIGFTTRPAGRSDRLALSPLLPPPSPPALISGVPAAPRFPAEESTNVPRRLPVAIGGAPAAGLRPRATILLLELPPRTDGGGGTTLAEVRVPPRARKPEP